MRKKNCVHKTWIVMEVGRWGKTIGRCKKCGIKGEI
jgi:hypothetical protein